MVRQRIPRSPRDSVLKRNRAAAGVAQPPAPGRTERGAARRHGERLLRFDRRAWWELPLRFTQKRGEQRDRKLLLALTRNISTFLT